MATICITGIDKNSKQLINDFGKIAVSNLVSSEFNGEVPDYQKFVNNSAVAKKLGFVNKREVNKELGTSFNKYVNSLAKPKLMKAISKKNNENVSKGLNEIYMIFNLRQLGQSDLFTWGVRKIKGNLNIQAKKERAIERAVDPNQRINRLETQDAQMSLFSLSEIDNTEINDKGLRASLESFMGANGIRQESLPELLNILKKQNRISDDIVGIRGISDAVNKLVAVTEGSSTDILAEEVSHMAISMLGPDHHWVKPALERIKEWDKYNELSDTYVPVYQEKLGLSLEEAKYHADIEILGHLLMEEVLNKNPQSITGRLKSNLSRIWSRFLDLFKSSNAKSFQQTVEDSLGQLATEIVKGNTINQSSSNTNPESIFFNIAESVTNNLTKDIINELEGRIKRLEKSIASSGKGNYDTIARLKSRKKELQEKITDKQTEIAIWNHLKTLDGELLDIKKKLTTASDSLIQDGNRIEEISEFVQDNEDMVERMGSYLRETLETRPDSIPEENLESINQLLSNARNSIKDLKNKSEKLLMDHVDRTLSRENPEEYKKGSIYENYTKDLGLFSWLQAFTGSVKNASNIVIRTSFKLMNNIHNKVFFEATRVKNGLVPLLIDAEKEGFKSQDLYEVDENGLSTGYLINRYNRGKIDQVYKDTEAELVKLLSTETNEYTNYNDILKERTAILEKIKLGETPNGYEKNFLNLFKKKWKDAKNKIYNPNAVPTIAPTIGDSIVLENSFIGYKFNALDSIPEVSGAELNLQVGEIVSIADKDGNSTRVFAKVMSAKDGRLDFEIIEGTDIGIRKEYLANEATYRKFVPEDGVPKNATQRFYAAYLKELQAQKGKLNTKYQIGDQKWLMPQMMASKEDLIREGRFTAFPERFKRTFTKNADDDVYGGEGLSIKGKMKKYLPVYFTKKVDQRLITHDVVGALSKFSAMAENFKQLNENKGDLLLLQRHLSESVFETKTLFGQNNKSGSDTATYKMLDEFLRTHLYGEKQTASDGLVNDKAVSEVYNWIQSSNLAFSIPIAVSGALKSNIDQSIERVLGEVITKDSSIYSTKETAKVLKGVLADTGARVKKHKISHLLELTGLGFESADRNLNLNSKAARVLGTDLMYSPYVVTETDRKMRLLISIMDNYREIDGELQSRHKYMKSQEDKEAAKKKWDAAREQSLYNKASMKDGKLTGITKEELSLVRNAALDLGPRLEGRISMLERGAAYRNPWLRFVFMHRSWLISGVENRFKSHIHNALTGVEEEGTYVSMYKILSGLHANIGNVPALKQYWNTLPEYQKRNALRTSVDFAWMVAISLIAAALNAASDDDDDWMTQYLAYQGSRLLLEQQAFWNPGELIAVIKSPAAGVNHIEDTMSLLGEIIFDHEPIASGPYEDMYKWQRFAIKRSWFKSMYELQYPRTKNTFLRSQVLKTGINTMFYEPIEEAFK